MRSKKDNADDDFFNDGLDVRLDSDWSPSSELKKKGIYYITGEIGFNSLLDIHQDILLKHMDPKWTDDIQLIINSYGGYVAEGYSLIDLLDWVRMDVRTIAIGFCGSM
jgi:ATP-dependent protease ClpP protease subunit